MMTAANDAEAIREAARLIVVLILSSRCVFLMIKDDLGGALRGHSPGGIRRWI
jgi:hypothetical protein